MTGLLARERLFAALDRDDGRVTLVRAPAGAGKTALLTSWAARCADRVAGDASPVAVVPLTPAHGEPAAFSRAVHDAVAGAGGSPLVWLVPRPRRGGPALCLALDGVDVLAGRPSARLLAALARHPSLRLVLAGRTPSPLRPWLRAHGRLREIGAADLAFTEDEARQLLTAHGVALSSPDLADLVRLTGGTAAGLRLAATSSSARGTPATTRPATVA
ncbi:hypothetical protein AB0A74_32885 [Saccharothrix sp. NPDC042600]|uniref:hypothetical protein n=1 Tax=Saccharothrix TaxID=2071 RepID=UPI0033ED0D73